MKVNKDIWDKARAINREKAELNKYINTCNMAKICPQCGAELKDRYDFILLRTTQQCIKCDWRS